MQRLHILLVDDEPGVLRALTLLLQAFEHSVTAFAAATEAYQFLTAHEAPDLILSDLRMPGMSGIQLLDSVRQLSLEVPFILMSGHATAKETEEAAQLGSSAFLPKPFTPVQLKAVLQELFPEK